MRHEGVSGFGEAAPIEHYAESAASRVAWLERRRARRRSVRARRARGAAAAGRTGSAGRRSTRRCTTCRASSPALPVYQLLGLRRDGPPTSWTIWLGDPDDMARRAERIAARGFRRLKLKLGGRDGLDVERVRAVRAVTDLPLQCDVNEYWTLDEALEYLPQIDAPVLRAAAAGRRPGRAGAEAPLAGPDLRRRGLPHARRRRRVRRARARDQHQAGEVGRHPRGRPDGRTPPVRSGSG